MKHFDSRKAFLAAAVVAGAAVFALASSPTRADIQLVMGIDLSVVCIQAKKEGKEPPTFDAKISPALKTELLKVYGLKYKSYTVTKQESWMLTVKPQGQDPDKQKNPRQALIDVGIDKPLSVTYLDHRAYMVRLQIQCGSVFSLPEIPNDSMYFMKVTDAVDPIIVVLVPKMIEIRK